MCCGPDTLLWFAVSVFWVADMIGIDGHVSFLPPKKKGKKGAIRQWQGSLRERMKACLHSRTSPGVNIKGYQLEQASEASCSV